MRKKLIYYREGTTPPELKPDEEAVALSEADYMQYQMLNEISRTLRK